MLAKRPQQAQALWGGRGTSSHQGIVDPRHCPLARPLVVRAHERALVAYALDVLPREVPGIELYGPLDPDKRGGVIPFNLPGVHPHDVAQVLDRFGIAIRAGHHCTMPLHERLDLAATARASLSA